MSLRVTQGMVYGSALNQIRAATLRGLDLRVQVASGRRVGVPSDDPAAILQIMPLRGEIRDLQQTMQGLAQGRQGIDNATAVLEQASATMQELRELTVQAANGTMSASDRLNMVAQVDQLLQEMLASANATWNGRYLFAGTATTTTPFSLLSGATGMRVAYRGDSATTGMQIAPGVSTDLNLPGDQVFLARSRQPTTFQGSTGARPSGAADSGVGFGTLDVTFGGLAFPPGLSGIVAGDSSTTALGNVTYQWTAGSPATLSVNGGPATVITGGVQSFPVGSGTDTVSLKVTGPVSPPSGTITSQALLSTDGGQTGALVASFATGQAVQVRSSIDGTVTNVQVDGLVRIGQERVTYHGTFDPFTTLIAVRDLLQNSAGDPDAVVATRLNGLLPEVDFAHDGILDGLQELGNRSQSLQLFESRLGELELSRTAALSDLEDIDLSEAILRFNQQDLSFQASLQIGARAIQTTLLDFLR